LLQTVARVRRLHQMNITEASQHVHGSVRVRVVVGKGKVFNFHTP
jgi:hypothetical protein